MKSKIYHISEPMRDMIKAKYQHLRGRHNQFYPGRGIAELHNMQRCDGIVWNKEAERWETNLGLVFGENVELRWPQPTFPAWMYEDDGITKSEALDGIREAFEQAKRGDIHPIETLWDDIDE